MKAKESDKLNFPKYNSRNSEQYFGLQFERPVKRLCHDIF
jgi:hypothetical protein